MMTSMSKKMAAAVLAVTRSNVSERMFQLV